MKLLSVDNYIEFECIGGDCPISCCGGNWAIEVEEASYQYYMSVEGEFGKALREGILVGDKRKIFKLNEKTRDCVFLNENKLCRIYRELGPDALCYTCRTYPRSMYQVGDILFCFLTNSCPEVNRMIVQRKDFPETLFDDENIEMDADETNKANSTDWVKFNNAIRAFSAGMNLLQNRQISFRDRMFLILFYVERFQELAAGGKDVSELIEMFSNPEIYALFLANRDTNRQGYADKIHVFMMIYKTLMTDSYDHAMWKKCAEFADDIIHKGEVDVGSLKQTFLVAEAEDIQREFEQIMIYRFFAVFMQGFEKTDYLDKLAYEVIILTALESYIALTEAVQKRKCTQEDRILFYSLCGRIDHTHSQKEKLVNELKDGGFYEMHKLIRLVS